MLSFLFRLYVIILFEIYTWVLLRRRINSRSEIVGIEKLVIQFALLYGIFSFIYLNFIGHFGVLRYSYDTPILVERYYSKGDQYDNAPGSSFVIIVLIEILSLLDPFAVVQYVFSIILPIMLVLTAYNFFKEFAGPKESFTATIILVHIDIIFDSFTSNVKQDIALIILLAILTYFIKYRNKEIESQARSKEIRFSIFCLISSITIFCTHIASYAISLTVVPIFLVEWKMEDKKISIKPTRDLLVWPLSSFLFPYIYRTGPFELASWTYLIGTKSNISPQLVRMLMENPSEFFIVAAFAISGTVILLLHVFCWFWSATYERRIYVNSPLVITPLILFSFGIYTAAYQTSIESWSRSSLGYSILNLPRIILIIFAVVAILNIGVIQKTKLPAIISDSAKKEQANKQLSMLAFAVIFLIIYTGLLLFFPITWIVIGQFERKWLDYGWIPISWISSIFISRYELANNKSRSNIMIISVIFLCTLSILLGSKDPFFFYRDVWNSKHYN